MQAGFRLKRRIAYAQGIAEFPDLIADPNFRDFVCLYMAEGYKRNRNVVSVCNSDPAIVVLCARWVRRFATNPIVYSVQYHADQDLLQLREFWAAKLGVAPGGIRLTRKSNSGRLGGRTWRSVHGVLAITASDTAFRSRLQAWMDCLQRQWLDSTDSGRGAVW